MYILHGPTYILTWHFRSLVLTALIKRSLALAMSFSTSVLPFAYNTPRLTMASRCPCWMAHCEISNDLKVYVQQIQDYSMWFVYI